MGGVIHGLAAAVKLGRDTGRKEVTRGAPWNEKYRIMDFRKSLPNDFAGRFLKKE